MVERHIAVDVQHAEVMHRAPRRHQHSGKRRLHHRRRVDGNGGGTPDDGHLRSLNDNDRHPEQAQAMRHSQAMMAVKHDAVLVFDDDSSTHLAPTHVDVKGIPNLPFLDPLMRAKGGQRQQGRANLHVMTPNRCDKDMSRSRGSRIEG